MSKLPRYRYLLWLLMFLVRTAGALIMLVPALFVAEVAADLGVPPELAGAYVGFYIGFLSWACIIFVLFSGPIVNKVGAKRCASLGALFTFLGTLLTAFNPPNFLAACGIRFILGVGIVLATVGFTPITQTWFSSEEYGLVTGAIEASTSVGLMLNFLLTRMLFKSYKEAHLIYSIPFAIITLLWVILGRDPLVPSPKSEESYFYILKTRLPKAFGIREVKAVSILMVLAMGAGGAIVTWAPTFYNVERGWPLLMASMLVAMYNLVGIIGRPLGGWISDKIGLRRPLFILSGGMIFLCAFAAITFAGPASWFWFPLVGFLVGLNASCIMAVLLEHPEMSFDLLPVSISIVLFAGFLSMAIFPAVVGAFLDLTGSLYLGLLFVSALYIFSSIVGILIRETGWKVATKAAAEMPKKMEKWVKTILCLYILVIIGICITALLY